MREQKNTGKRSFAVVFLITLLGFSLANLALKGRAMSAEARKISWSFAGAEAGVDKLEEALSDHLLLRVEMIDGYGAVQKALGKREENAFDKVKDRNGFLYSGNFWNGFGDDTRELALRAYRLGREVTAQGGSFGVILFPMKTPEEGAAYYGIPYNDQNGRADSFAAWARHYSVPILDLRENWREEGLTQEEAFFRTDSSWTPRAAFSGYCAILQWMEERFGAQIPEREKLCGLSGYELTRYEGLMFGTYGKETGAVFAGGAEPYTLIRPKEEGDYLLRVGKVDAYKTHEGGFSQALLNPEHEQEGLFGIEAKDIYLHEKYADYISIINRQTESREKVLLLRDSFAAPVGAFLAQSFSQVDLLYCEEYTEEELRKIMEKTQYDYVFAALYPVNLSEQFFPFGSEEG